MLLPFTAEHEQKCIASNLSHDHENSIIICTNNIGPRKIITSTTPLGTCKKAFACKIVGNDI